MAELSPRWPFGMGRAVAAEYVGFSVSHFDKMVAEGTMPAPRREGSRLVWLQDELQAALRALPSKDEAPPADTTWGDTNAA